MKTLVDPIEFEWDEGNIDKNKIKHGIDNREAEESFFDSRSVIYKDVFHSKTKKETRYILLGKTKSSKLLYVVFTKRNKKIRIISVRVINKRETKFYEKTT